MRQNISPAFYGFTLPCCKDTINLAKGRSLFEQSSKATQPYCINRLEKEDEFQVFNPLKDGGRFAFSC